MTENNITPEPTPVTTPVADSVVIPPRGEQDSLAAPKRSRTRTLLIAGGSVLAAAVLAGGGIAVGAAIADETDDDDDRSSSSSMSDDDSANDARGDDDSAAGGQAADIGTESAEELSEVIAVASASADGDAVGIEANRDGSWDVTFETAGGDETEVRVASDGTAEVVSTDAADADDSAPLGVLDTTTVDALVAAAMAEVDGRITALEIDDDTASPFDISVVQANGRTLDLDLDADMAVLSINTN